MSRTVTDIFSWRLAVDATVTLCIYYYTCRFYIYSLHDLFNYSIEQMDLEVIL
jgi:hypothetical protein